MDDEPPDLDPVRRLTRDLRNAARTLGTAEARHLVDAYYAMQRDRIRAGHQERTLAEGGEPHDVMSWLADQRVVLESQIRRALDAYSAANPVGAWARSITGIGPVIAAGLLANIDIRRAPTVGHIWRFAGLDPTVQWLPKTKRPWNGSLKRLCFLIGESFVKVSNNPNDVYGKVYQQRKLYEQRRNEGGELADQAAASLKAKKFGEETDARKHYEAGHLPPARIHLRAQRYAVKLFLAHYHGVAFETEFGTPPPKPYILSAGVHAKHPEYAAHTHFIGPPNWPAAALHESTVPDDRTDADLASTETIDRSAVKYDSHDARERTAATGESAKPKDRPAKHREGTVPADRAAAKSKSTKNGERTATRSASTKNGKRQTSVVRAP